MTVDPDEWSTAGAIWIRTWYRNGLCPTECLNEGTNAHGDADEAYARLWRKALWPPSMHGFDSAMFGPYTFDYNAAGYEVLSRNADDEVELLGGIPSFILSALVRCPDSMEGSSECEIRDNEDGESTQALLMILADGQACEDGWVLLMAINEKGQVLPERFRCKAFEVGQNVASWKDDGEPLDLLGSGQNTVYYRDANRSGDGWDEK